MAASGPKAPSAEFYYGSILKAAAAHQTTAEVWDALRAQREAYGVPFPSDIFARVNELRANAGQVVRASETMSRASDTTAITSEVMGRPIYARSLASQEAVPSYEVRFSLVTQLPGGPQATWYRISYGSDLPDTIGALRDDVELYASDWAQQYGVPDASLGEIMLNAV